MREQEVVVDLLPSEKDTERVVLVLLGIPSVIFSRVLVGRVQHHEVVRDTMGFVDIIIQVCQRELAVLTGILVPHLILVRCFVARGDAPHGLLGEGVVRRMRSHREEGERVPVLPQPELLTSREGEAMV